MLDFAAKETIKQSSDNTVGLETEWGDMKPRGNYNPAFPGLQDDKAPDPETGRTSGIGETKDLDGRSGIGENGENPS